MVSLSSYPFLAFLLFGVLGACLGSFGSVLLARLPHGQSILGRSHCTRCRKKLSAGELVPLLSFLLQRGRCLHCEARISPLYPLLEIASGLLFGIALLWEGFAFLPALLLGLSLWLFFLVTVMDAQTGFISDYLSFPLLAVSVLYALLLPPFPLVAPLIGTLFFALQWGLSRGRWVGSGDIIMGAAMGFLLGDWRILLLALGISYIIGALAASFLIFRRRRKMKDHLPFVPFLYAGTLITLFAGYDILRMYLY